MLRILLFLSGSCLKTEVFKQLYLKISITGGTRLLYVLFLYAVIILGGALNFYRDFPHWDTLPHTCGGIMLGSFGFALIDILNENQHTVRQSHAVCCSHRYWSRV
jgi:hypothetical protein